MKVVTFEGSDGVRRPGILTDGEVFDISVVAGDVLELIALGSEGLGEAAALARKGKAMPLEAVRLLAPIVRTRRNIFCVGNNYREHLDEFQRSGYDSSAGATPSTEVPIVFSKTPSTIVGPGAPILAEFDPTGSVDYEGELAVVIGFGGRGISKDDAMQHVWGYTIVNDVTSRVLQQRHKQWFLGKNVDTFCPMGPCVVTADEFGDPTRRRLTTHVNGKVRQNASISDLIFDIPTLIATISETMTLEAGDLIATGTPAGVGIGFQPAKFLKPGDVVSIEIEGIGALENPVA